MASYDKKWMNRELTSDSMSISAGERETETEKLVENGELGMKIDA